LEDLAHHAGFGLSTFAHIYRKPSGETPCQSIVLLKMEAAKRLLPQDGLSAKETVALLGFSTELQFTRSASKRTEGRSPAAMCAP
jgi:AraC-like DNA-binding protein